MRLPWPASRRPTASVVNLVHIGDELLVWRLTVVVAQDRTSAEYLVRELDLALLHQREDRH